ncbi:MAG: TlpA family protein disulfide reductase [Candidatus Eisenbacteria bacterium]|nr:TlpA family protein disulfide reductase [Candidatus Eisenbacteria bacterium]
MSGYLCRVARGFLVLALCLVSGLVGESRAIDVGEAAPYFSLTDLDYDQHSLTAYRSHPVLLFFLECDATASAVLAPLIQREVYDVFAGQGLVVLGLDARSCSRTGLENFRDQTGVDYPLLLDAGDVQSTYGISDDSFVLVDGGGVVRYVAEGPGTGSYNSTQMKVKIEELLRDANNVKVSTWGVIKSIYQQ